MGIAQHTNTSNTGRGRSHGGPFSTVNSEFHSSKARFRPLRDDDGAAPPCALLVHSSGASLLPRPWRPRALSAARAADMLRSTEGDGHARANRRSDVHLTAANVQFSTQMMLTPAAQVDGATFRRHETSLGVLTRLADRSGDELHVIERAKCSSDTNCGQVPDVGRRVTSGDAAIVYHVYRVA